MKYIKLKHDLIVITVLSILSSIVSVLFPLSLMRISDSISKGNTRLFYINILLGVIIIILNMILYYVVERLQNRYVKNNIIIIRRWIAKNLLKMSYGEFKYREKSDYISIILNDIKILESDFYKSFLNCISKICVLIFSLVGLYIIKPILLVVVVVIIILMSLLPAIFQKKILKYREKYILINSEFIESTNECLDGFKIIKSYSMINKMLEIYVNKVKKFEESNKQMKDVLAFVNTIFGVTTMIISILIFTIGGLLVINNKLTIGGLIAAVQLLMYIIEPTTNIAECYNNINSTKPIRNRIDEIIKYNDNIEKEKHKIDKVNKITLKNLSYKYNDSNKYILKDINFTFEAGKKYAIIGENGSGKSTLLKIIGNLISNYEGRILINNIEYRDLDSENIFNLISFVHQDDFLFNASIKDNILLFNDDSSNDEKIERLMDSLYLSDKLKYNINTNIGYNGEYLSGGEKQKISIMRALLNSRSVLLLDEVNSALDKFSADKVMDIVSGLEDMMSITITHKIDESLKKFDKVIIIENGKIIDLFSYENFKKKNIILTSTL